MTSTTLSPDTLNKMKGNAASPALPEELSYIITSFIPSQSADNRSKAYLTLSAFCQGVRSSFQVKGKTPDPATAALVKVFTPEVLPRLQETDDNVLVGISFLTALFQVDWESASSIFLQDGVLELVMDNVDLMPSPDLTLHAAHLLGQACGHKPCREIMSSEAIRWLESKSHQNQDTALRAAAAIALIKLSKGSAVDSSEATGSDPPPSSRTNDDELADMMKQMVIGGNQSSTADAVEGLAYLSADPVIKEALSKDPVFLKKLFSLVPRRKSTNPTDYNATILFGILVIVCNLCTYRPQLTDEQTQMEKLKRMAKAGNTSGTATETSSALDDDEKVKARAQKLVAAGVLEVFASAVPGVDSLGVRLNVGKALLGIVTDKENRGSVLKSGGAKILALIIKSGLPTTTSGKGDKTQLDPVYLEPIQALAKLAITSSPVQVFGPNVGAVYDAIRPFSIMLQHPSSTLLQRFEALMALTNVASHGPETASRVAEADGLMNKTELLLLEEHPLVRRAAMELICNLIGGSDTVFDRYGGSENNGGTKNKLQLVLAMSDVEDLPTRIAASGALATVTAAPSACQVLLTLQMERHRVLPTLTQLIDPTVAPDVSEPEELGSHPGLVHRGVVCARNFILHLNDTERKKILKEAAEAGLIQALMNVTQSAQTPVEVKHPAAETLLSLTKSE